MLKRRVVVTGMGMVSPLGTGVEKTWNALIQGKSGVGRITKFDSTGFDTQIAAEVKDFAPENFMDKKEIPAHGYFYPVCHGRGRHGHGRFPVQNNARRTRSGWGWSWAPVWGD